MKLYYSRYTRSGRARWILEEIGVAYEIARLSFQKGEHKAPEYLEIHPHGSVPALTDGDLKIYESSAILLHLADKYPDAKLAPPLGSDERGLYYRWLVWMSFIGALEGREALVNYLKVQQQRPAYLRAHAD